MSHVLGILRILEDTSQSSNATLHGYHKGFWTVNQSVNQPTMAIPSHQVYGHDGVTKIVGRPGMRGRVINGKRGPVFHSTDDGGPVSNPVGGVPLTVGVDYTSRI